MSPTVGKGKGKKHFPYTAKGKKEAKEEAEHTGMPMTKHMMPEMHKKPVASKKATGKGKK